MKRTIARSLIVVFVLFLVITGKFAYIQLFQSDELQKETVDQRVRKIKELPERGEIVDSEGRTLAMSLNAKNIAVYPNIIKTKETRKNISKLLSDVLDVSYKDVLKKVSSKNKKGEYQQWVSIANRVGPEKAEELKQSKYSGYIEISNAPKRYYPNGKLASTILGFVNYQSEPGAGLEMSLNHYLAGIPGYTIAEFDHSRKEIPIGFQTDSKPVAGNKVTLTVDSYIQYTLEQTLENVAKELKPERMHAIVMDPNTGKVLGMSSYPSFDPNDYTAANQSDINLNAASYVYEPGSTFKPVYMAAALNGGYINKDFTYYDGGTINVAGTTIRNWDGGGLGRAGLQDIIVNSSNVGMINVSKSMTSEQTLKGIKKAGIGQKTGIELPNEEVGLIPSAKRLNNDPVAKATVSFGQGISVTPIQLITSFSEIINGGYDILPTILEKVEDDFGNVQYEWKQDKKIRKYKQNTVDLMKSYLKANMEIGSGKNVQISGYDGGGKTGSAWKVENGRYASGKIIGSFMGFIPYDHPKYVMLAVVDDPKGAEFGSTSGGPVFQQAMTEILRYKGEEKTVPDKGKKTIAKSKKMSVPDVSYELFDNAKQYIEDKVDGKVTIKKDGPGEVVVSQDYEYKDDTLVVNLKTVSIKGEGKSTYIPNVEGIDIDEAKKIFKKYNIKVTAHGSEKVEHQETKPGEYGKEISKIKLWCD
ncbi:penicillin-binding transpeptidase domain-containing protein [Bacillus mexicanus]|uniref:penicillin-binding transpeptidase domain-containing protein n=1 Tax=Bacillus mexicanus TaxID=2834415 RepID=UPI003D1F1678